MANKVPELQDLNDTELKNLILNVIAKHRDALSYFKTDVSNDRIQDFEEALISKLIDGYNKKNHIKDTKVEPKSKIKKANNIIQKILKI